ncbi:MAG: polyphosphate:AMP phosphotransferase [Leptospiraceae bacterium]|nr:polyphosphate:AMP phosphotransferase [Leptospiraceae bacterium]
MFRTAELGQKLSKEEYKRIEPDLRFELHELQRKTRSLGKYPVIIVLAGVDGGGKGDTVKILNEWMDARWVINRAYRPASDEEKERPRFWRYWRDLPPRGQIGLFMSAWYSSPVVDYAHRKISRDELDRHLEQIENFENALADDGALILKFWMHLSRDAQKKRFKSLEKDPDRKWEVNKRDWDNWKRYDQFIEAAERTIMRTNTGKAAWNIIEGSDNRYRRITIGTILRDAMQKKLNAMKNQSAPTLTAGSDISGEQGGEAASLTVFSGLDMAKGLDRNMYKSELRKFQAKMNHLTRKGLKQEMSTIVVFEGPDAAGKGGAIRRVISALDPHHYQILPFAAPTEEERAQHYLWRFWRHLSRAGDVTIFDRSWYGRVLVERVEGFATNAEWQRAYAEINDFEQQLVEHNIVLIKFWVHITKEEQLRRFQEREKTPHKSWKLTDEDWRNREKWDLYSAAAHDMIQYTSTQSAPWVIVEGNDKYYARVKTIRTVCDYLTQALDR